MRRREFITILGGATAWPLAVGAREAAMPVVAFVSPSERDSLPPRYVAAFRKGLSDTGYIEGQNVAVEYHWVEGRYDRIQHAPREPDFPIVSRIQPTDCLTRVRTNAFKRDRMKLKSASVFIVTQ